MHGDMNVKVGNSLSCTAVRFVKVLCVVTLVI